MKIALAVAVAVAACTLAGTVRADGDPASDYLLAQNVFLPFDAKFPAKTQAQLVGLVDAANKAGFKIRVALIWSSYDMGSVTVLWQKPKTYARFLGEELSFLYKQRVLIVMPNGFGFSWRRHPSASEYAILQKIPIQPGAAGLVDAAQTAVQRLAAADGVHVSPPANVTSPARRNSHDRLVIILASLAAAALAVVLRFALSAWRRRRSPTSQRSHRS
ncbi:MAG TPA: hypothetical protein VFM96_03880 [Gaiellaceae bacterium]|nr:hypothetical protein [Gaiellaceae bacterium]